MKGDSLESLELPLVSPAWLWLWMGSFGAATGALAGGIEVVGLGLSMRLELSLSESLALGLGTVALDALVGLGAGVAGGAAATVLLGVRPWKRYRAGFAVMCGFLAAFFLVPEARVLWMGERRDAAVGMLALCGMIFVLGWFNAGYWFRRCVIGGGPPYGWRLVAPATGLVLALAAAALGGPGGPTQPLVAKELPNLVLVTIDTLRRDHVGLYGTLVNTPRMGKLGAEGVVYDDAVTPLPETLPAHVAMMSGLQPSQAHVLSNGSVLSPGFLTLPEQLSLSGYQTGAFVSSFAVDADTGLHQGFQVYDDDFFPFLRGITQAKAAGVGLPLLMRFGDPAAFPFLLERGTPETLRRALTWVDRVRGEGRPLFLWIHTFDPHSPYEPRDGTVATVDHRAILAQEPGYTYSDEERTALKEYYRQEAEYSDQQVGVLFDALRERGVLDNALFVVTADHGESLGEHGINFTHHGVYETVLRVPLVVWSSKALSGAAGPVAPGTRVARQVNLADLANTFLEYAGLPLLTGTNSIPLLTHLRGDVPPLGLVVSGREGMSLSEGQLCGVRDPKGIKYIRRQDGHEEFYDLRADPAELQNIAASQPLGVEAGRQSVEACVGRALTEAPVLDRDECERLKALGYFSGDCG